MELGNSSEACIAPLESKMAPEAYNSEDPAGEESLRKKQENSKELNTGDGLLPEEKKVVFDPNDPVHVIIDRSQQMKEEEYVTSTLPPNYTPISEVRSSLERTKKASCATTANLTPMRVDTHPNLKPRKKKLTGSVGSRSGANSRASPFGIRSSVSRLKHSPSSGMRDETPPLDYETEFLNSVLSFVHNKMWATNEIESGRPRGIPVSNARLAATLKREN